MNVAYDKLGLVRSADEPAPNFLGYTDQPFLDEMTDAAIKILSKDDAPFILWSKERASTSRAIQTTPPGSSGT